MDHLTYHVCGGLPVTQLIMHVTRCHHHEAWSVVADVRTQRDANPEVLLSMEHSFGPFDELDTVGREIARTLRELLEMLRVATI